MSPSAHFASSRNAFGSLLSSAAALLAGRGPSAEGLRGVDARTLVDIGIDHVGQGPAALHVAVTDTGRLEVKKPLERRRAD